MKFNQHLISVLSCLISLLVVCQGSAIEDAKPIRALLITGGCCHDYETQKQILSEGISARCKLKIEWTIVHQGGSSTNTKIPFYENEDWAKGYDIVIHNECFSDVDDKAWVERILKPHRDGIPAIVIHCAMHSYRKANTETWRDFLGVTSPGHGSQHPIKIENMAKDNPIVQGFGDEWTTPQGELYFIDNIGPKTTPLARGFSNDRKDFMTCIWTNEFGKGRVFGTTIGHHNETMASAKYLNFMARGFLWALDKLEAENLKEPEKKKVRENLSLGKTASAAASQDGHPPEHAIDGDDSTRWCSPNNDAGYWWQVDLGKPQEITGVKIYWEQAGRKYDYKVEGSPDGKQYQLLLDKTNNDSRQQIQQFDFEAKDIRYVRLTTTGLPNGSWGSFFEFAVLGTNLVDSDEFSGFDPGKISTKSLLADVKASDEFDVSIFAAPPEVNYPVSLCSAPDGTLYVAVDKNGSLDRQPDRGSVVRCRDTDGDGKADEIKEFCRVDSPRGLMWDRDRLYVLHPPDLSVYFDEDGDGRAERSETLVKGIGFDLSFRGADHTTNGIRMGIDGWIYIAVGDYGFIKAEGRDGRTLQMKGGGIVRVRPDGTEMETYCRGLRNILDVCIDPRLNMFTRDNTNDGGGWDIRLSHIVQSANYGYPSLFKNFGDEIMPPLAVYGGGSGCGGVYVAEPTLPAKYRDALLTCDWGRNEVFYHPLEENGATFSAGQETFVKITRPTDIDVDAAGRIYVSSWRGGEFNYKDESVGYVAMLRGKDSSKSVTVPDYKQLNAAKLLDELASISHVRRLAAQREILHRSKSLSPADQDVFVKGLTKLMSGTPVGSGQVSLDSRIAAIFTYAQLPKIAPLKGLFSLCGDEAIQEYAIRAISDRQLPNSVIPLDLLATPMTFKNPRAQLAALVGLGRSGNIKAAEFILPFAALNPDAGMDFNQQIDSDRALSHVAVQSLVKLNAVDACLDALNGPNRVGALRALRYMHNDEAVEGLAKMLTATKDAELRDDVLKTLVRLYHEEGPYEGKWWGTRPDTNGPYYDRKLWKESERIASLVREQLPKLSEESLVAVFGELESDHVKLENIPGELVAKAGSAAKKMQELKVSIPTFDPKDPNQIGNLKFAQVLERTMLQKGDAAVGEKLFKQQSCVACHTLDKNQQPVGPQLVDIGKRYKREELIESIVQPSAKIAQGFATNFFEMQSGKSYTGFVVREAADEIEIRTTEGKKLLLAIDEIDQRSPLPTSSMPEGMVNNLTGEQLASLIAYLESLKSGE